MLRRKPCWRSCRTQRRRPKIPRAKSAPLLPKPLPWPRITAGRPGLFAMRTCAALCIFEVEREASAALAAAGKVLAATMTCASARRNGVVVGGGLQDNSWTLLLIDSASSLLCSVREMLLLIHFGIVRWSSRFKEGNHWPLPGCFLTILAGLNNFEPHLVLMFHLQKCKFLCLTNSVFFCSTK